MKKFHRKLSLSLLGMLILFFPGSSSAQNVRPFARQLTPDASEAQSLAAPV